MNTNEQISKGNLFKAFVGHEPQTSRDTNFSMV